MRAFSPVLLLAAVASAQSTSSSTTTSSLSSASGSSSMSAELAAIAVCNQTQLDAAQETLQTNQREKQCEEALGLSTGSGTMLQVTTAQATEICATTSCKAALQELYNELPNCRYNNWGLQYSAKKLLEYCGATPTNTTDTSSDSSSGSVGWSVTSSSDSSNGSVGWSVTSSSASFAPAGATDAPSTASSTTKDSSAASKTSGSSAATTTTAVSAALAATAGLVAAFLA